jgi:hypothetical protein
MDISFLNLCYDVAAKRGYIVDGPDALKPYIPCGAFMAITSYAHIRNTSVQLWMALYTACGIYCDDKFQKDSNSAAMFCERFMRGQPQGDRALDAFVDLALETSSLFPRVRANLIVSSTLNFITSLLVDEQMQGLKVSAYADNYPAYSRIMSGLSEPYALAAFPAELPLESFIHALPSLLTFTVNANDVLSFYKEEILGETVTLVLLVESCQGCSRSHAFHSIINEAVEAHEKILRILAPNKAALDAYQSFASGYVDYHTSLNSRYHLDELEFNDGADS